MTTLSTDRIYVELGGRSRELVFNLNSAILLRNAGFAKTPLLERIEDDDNGKPQYRVDINALRAYLWAGLQTDARAKGEALSIDDLGEMITVIKQGTYFELWLAVSNALDRLYGREVSEPGEAEAAPKAKRSGKKAGR